jgi:hypothetical protein
VQHNAPLPFPAADLRVHPPRPARVQLGGIMFMARTVDKMRAKIQGTLGPYKIAPGISAYIFEGLDITEEQFEEAVRNASTDADIVAWLEANTDPAKIPALNDMLVKRGIRDAEHRAQVLPSYPILANRPNLTNWFEIFDLDDEWMYESGNRGKPGAAPLPSPG